MDAQRAAVARVAAVSRQFWDDLERAAVGLGPDENWPTPDGDDFRSGDWDEIYGDADDEGDD